MSNHETHARAGVRLSCVARADTGLKKSVPGVYQALLECGQFADGGQPLDGRPIVADSTAPLDSLSALLLSPERALPVVVLSPLQGRRTRGPYAIDPDGLARDLLGHAHVATLSNECLPRLCEHVAGHLTPRGGAIRVYATGVVAGDNILRHSLYLLKYVKKVSGAQAFDKFLIERMARAGLDERSLGLWPQFDAKGPADGPALSLLASVRRWFSGPRAN